MVYGKPLIPVSGKGGFPAFIMALFAVALIHNCFLADPAAAAMGGSAAFGAHSAQATNTAITEGGGSSSPISTPPPPAQEIEISFFPPNTGNAIISQVNIGHEVFTTPLPGGGTYTFTANRIGIDHQISSVLNGATSLGFDAGLGLPRGAGTGGAAFFVDLNVGANLNQSKTLGGFLRFRSCKYAGTGISGITQEIIIGIKAISGNII